MQIIYGGAGYQGPLGDVCIYNAAQNAWSRPAVSGEQPSAREMHAAVMLNASTMLVFGGRGDQKWVGGAGDGAVVRGHRSAPTPSGADLCVAACM
jgi:hypothetical protein